MFWFTILNATDFDSLYKRTVNLQLSNPDLAIENFNSCAGYFQDNCNTKLLIDVKLRLIQLYSGTGNYQKAYDEAWSLLPIVDVEDFAEEKVQLNRLLASLYIIFARYHQAHIYLEEAIAISNSFSKEQTRSDLLTGLYSQKAWLITNEIGDFKASEKWLKLALEENAKTKIELGRIYTEMQLAELYIRHDSLQDAQALLISIEQATSVKYKPAHSLLFDHFGQLYMKKNEYDSAVFYFQRCIEAIDLYKNHLDNKIEVLDSLSSCFHYLGEDDLAFHYSRQAQQTSKELFGSKSKMNKELFEIKDSYQEQLEKQRVDLLEEEKKVLRLKSVIYISVLTLVILALIVRSRYRTRKQKQLREQQKEEQRQKDLELESKNKELMSSALQLLERDALLNEVRESLGSLEFKAVNQDTINGLISSINANKAHGWNEFELYFTEVNESYYSVLKANYPALSATDLKMCALIKLGFSSKEMADIMGIGADSVKTSRSRIRKKIGLARDVNLTSFLGQIE